MILINKEEGKFNGEPMHKYYYDDLGGLKGIANILRKYENNDYIIKMINIDPDTDYIYLYEYPEKYFSLDSFEEDVNDIKSIVNGIVANLSKNDIEYSVGMSIKHNMITVFPSKKKDENIDFILN